METETEHYRLNEVMIYCRTVVLDFLSSILVYLTGKKGSCVMFVPVVKLHICSASQRQDTEILQIKGGTVLKKKKPKNQAS